MLRRALFSLFCLIGLMAGFVSPVPASAAPPAAPSLPSGFVDELVTAASSPTALAFAPDGRMLITLKGGQLVVRRGTTNTTALNISARTCSAGEQGLLGVAVDPSFSSNGYVYLYYTVTDAANGNRCVNRVSRFTMSGDRVVSGSEKVLIYRTPYQDATNHNAGDLHFGGDGYLYISVGDGGCDYAGSGCAAANDAARERNTLLGKILRIKKDGPIPPDNPWTGADSGRCNVEGRTSAAKCQETFVWGLRNPFRFAFNPNYGNIGFHINDVGQNVWEEVDRAQKGADYGWNHCEGSYYTGTSTNCDNVARGMTDPVYDYNHDTGCTSITGGAFVPNGVWPGAYNDNYLYGDYVCNKIFRLTYSSSTGRYTASTFASGLGGGGPVHMEFGPAGSSRALYYTTFVNGGEVRRIRYVGSANQPPVASIAASPKYGPIPLTVSFDASASRDPEGGALSYNWDFDGNGTIDSRSAKASYTYSSSRDYTARLRVWDAAGQAGYASVLIAAGNTPPDQPVITSPATTAQFSVGQAITLSGRATDAEDGAIPDSRLSWTVLLHHNTHTHPFFSGTGNNLTFQAPAPEDLLAASNSYLEVYLRATDSRGLYRTTYQRLNPRKVSVTFKTSNPAGLSVVVNGTTYDTTDSNGKTFVSWQGYRLSVNAPNQGGYVFDSWSDGGAQSHTITTPSGATTYTARFK